MDSPGTASISVVGLGKLGSCLAASLANAGFSVVGADLDESVVEAINGGRSPVPEPKMEEYLTEADENIRATTDTQQAVRETDVTFVAVNTPSTEAGRYALDAVNSVCRSVGESIARKDDYHVVVLTSTVFPGATNGEVSRTLETASGKTAGEEFGLCYSPEFIAIGNVIEGLENPDFFLVGEHTERAGDVVASIYDRMAAEPAPMVRMPPEEAEITKMAVNSYVTMKISFANTLAEVCDGTGARVDDVTDALAEDERISGSYLGAGGRYGGPCFPRDNVAFAQLARDAGTDAPLAESTDVVNDQHTDWIANVVRETTPDDGTVGLLGMSYKPGTYIITESQGSALYSTLDDEFALGCYDPMGMEEVNREFGNRVSLYDSTGELLEAVDTAVVTIPWDEFDAVEAYESFSGTLVDPWRRFRADELPDVVQYLPVGNGRVTQRTVERAR